MSNSEVRPVKKAQGVAPDAYYYLGRYMVDRQRIRSQRHKDREEMESRLKQLTVKYFGSTEKDGLLQLDLNRYYNNILKDMKRDYPQFSDRMILVFSYSAARIPRSLIREWAGFPTEGAVSSFRSRMKSYITYHVRERQAEYLYFLSQ